MKTYYFKHLTNPGAQLYKTNLDCEAADMQKHPDYVEIQESDVRENKRGIQPAPVVAPVKPVQKTKPIEPMLKINKPKQ